MPKPAPPTEADLRDAIATLRADVFRLADSSRELRSNYFHDCLQRASFQLARAERDLTAVHEAPTLAASEPIPAWERPVRLRLSA